MNNISVHFPGFSVIIPLHVEHMTMDDEIVSIVHIVHFLKYIGINGYYIYYT